MSCFFKILLDAATCLIKVTHIVGSNFDSFICSFQVPLQGLFVIGRNTYSATEAEPYRKLGVRDSFSSGF